MQRDHYTSLFGTLAALIATLFAGAAEAEDLRSWDRKIEDGAERFRVLPQFDFGAVLDEETQLVWTRDAAFIGQREWQDNKLGQTGAREVCATLVISDRGGWRLPSLHELSGLADTSQQGLTLSKGHPFQNVQGRYWTATTSARNPVNAWTVAFQSTFGTGEFPKNTPIFVWCVRGGNPGPDKY
jgi:Protein of unknown function (DUF1566)